MKEQKEDNVIIPVKLVNEILNYFNTQTVTQIGMPMIQKIHSSIKKIDAKEEKIVNFTEKDK